MKLSNIIASTSELYADRKPIHLIGAPGCGKSSIVHVDMVGQLEAEYKEPFGMVTFYLTSVDAPDVRGFCIPTKDENGKPIAVFTQSAIATAIEATGCARGILFLDERSQADQLVQKAIAPVVLDRVIGDYKMPDGWWIVSASNRQKDRSGVSKPLAHLVNRERTIQVEADVDGLVKFLERKQYHPLTIAFLKHRPGLVITNEVPAGEGPYCTPRSFESAINYLSTHPSTTDYTIPIDSVTQELVQGDIGEGTAIELFSFLKVSDKLPTIDEIIKNPKKAKLPKVEQLDAQYAAMQLCVHHANADNVDPLFEYVQRLNEELQVSAAKSILEKSGGKLLNSPALVKFVSEHRALITASNAE